jgi:hypothetical protein
LFILFPPKNGHVNNDGVKIETCLTAFGNRQAYESCKPFGPKLKAELAQMLSDHGIAAQHNSCVRAHRDKIKALSKSDSFEKFYTEITSPRMERLGRLHKHFGANVFLGGP